MSAVSLAERHFAALITDDAEVRAERIRRLTLIEHLYTPLPINAAVARSYGNLAAAVTRRPAGNHGRGSCSSPRPRTRTMPRSSLASPDDLCGIEHPFDIVSI